MAGTQKIFRLVYGNETFSFADGWSEKQIRQALRNDHPEVASTKSALTWIDEGTATFIVPGGDKGSRSEGN